MTLNDLTFDYLSTMYMYDFNKNKKVYRTKNTLIAGEATGCQIGLNGKKIWTRTVEEIEMKRESKLDPTHIATDHALDAVLSFIRGFLSNTGKRLLNTKKLAIKEVLPFIASVEQTGAGYFHTHILFEFKQLTNFIKASPNLVKYEFRNGIDIEVIKNNLLYCWESNGLSTYSAGDNEEWFKKIGSSNEDLINTISYTVKQSSFNSNHRITNSVVGFF